MPCMPSLAIVFYLTVYYSNAYNYKVFPLLNRGSTVIWSTNQHPYPLRMRAGDDITERFQFPGLDGPTTGCSGITSPVSKQEELDESMLILVAII